MTKPVDNDIHTWLKQPQPLFIGGSLIAAVSAVLAEGAGHPMGYVLLGLSVAVICSWTLTGTPTLTQAVVIMMVAMVALGWTADDPESALFQPVLLSAAVGWKIKTTRLSVLLLLLLASIPVLGILGPGSADWGWWKTELTDARGQLMQVAAREERRRISRDIHDLVGHSLTAMLLNVRAAQRDFTDNPRESLKALTDAETTGVRGVEDIRAAMVGLRSDVVSGETDKEGLTSLPDGESIQRLLQRQNHLCVKTSGDLQTLKGPVGIAVYRTLQECITNITKHSSDGAGNLNLTVCDKYIELQSNNAVSESFKPPLTGATLGLIGMRERVTAQGGTLSTRIDKKRWHLECRIPIHD